MVSISIAAWQTAAIHSAAILRRDPPQETKTVMRKFIILLALVTTGLVCTAEETNTVVITTAPIQTSLASEKTKLPWHLVNIWWVMPETADFESIEIDVTISEDVDPSKLNLYIAPMGLGKLNDISFYGGIQTNIGGYPVTDASPQVVAYHKGKGAIFSRWGNKDLDTSFVRPAVNGLTEAAGYEGDFASGRRPFPWKAGTYTYAVRKMMYEKDRDGKESTWVGAFLTEKSSNQTIFIAALKFPGRTLKFWGQHASFIEIYGGKKVVIADLPKLEVRFGMPRVNGQSVATRQLSVSYPKDGSTASPAIMTSELSADGKEVICKLHQEILTREKWSFPLLQATQIK